MADIDKTKFQQRMQAMTALPDQVIKQAYDYFVKSTPKKTGNARRQTKLRDNSIEANYDYAAVLDGGRRREGTRAVGSTQAPRGMTQPTIKELQKIVRKQAKRIGAK